MLMTHPSISIYNISQKAYLANHITTENELDKMYVWLKHSKLSLNVEEN